ncbi:CMP-N-acetylneuraminate-poly-alpha-2,8-sialyltransferase-like [Saccoglossus kowalevskii]|uniref:CMP-N-acetylneuraminate-poly-alpha-2, 8-sialyltransferase-like n=1 Tax=Saccoglossus kowalevskii TaxID=10224 RepID=A0ABM0MKJ6_SACKO|nr:PREDICTED: CMP-N-acetylneuraminate-poly-alpha-2,8-sialyltransferase-like [Saccoglossus kowalevskii]
MLLTKLVAKGNPFTINMFNESVLIPRQKTCAVVGNSGILLNSSCGKGIDFNDFVIRCNLPDIEKFSHDVGKKTNIIILDKTRVYDIFSYAKKHSETPNLLNNFIFLNNTVLWSSSSNTSIRYRRLVYSTKYLKEQFDLNFNVTYSSSLRPCFRLLKIKSMVTAGMHAVCSALRLCDRVSIYGFYPFPTRPDGSIVPYHYYDELTLSSKTRHDFNKEHSVLQSLGKDGLLHFVSDKCNT